MGQAAEIRVLRGTVVHGPFTPEQIADLHARGRITDAEMVSVRNGPWVRVEDYLGRQPSAPPAQPPPAPPPPVAATTTAVPLSADAATDGWAELSDWKRPLAVAGVLAACALGVAITGSVSLSKKPGGKQAPRESSGGQFLKSFDEHPAPVIDSAKHGKRVWLLEGYRSDTQTGLHRSHREALYVVFREGTLEYVVHKTHHDPNNSKRFFGVDYEVDEWHQMPAGKSNAGKVSKLSRFWDGQETEGDVARLNFKQEFENDSDPDSVMKGMTVAEITIRWNKGGVKAGWESAVHSHSTLRTRGREFASEYHKEYSGPGELLQSR